MVTKEHTVVVLPCLSNHLYDSVINTHIHVQSSNDTFSLNMEKKRKLDPQTHYVLYIHTSGYWCSSQRVRG